MVIQSKTKEGIIICGPTASNKSSYALKLAKEVKGAIINADSCQIYAEVPIITSSPSAAAKAEIPHLLYNYVDLTQRYSVAKYVQDAVGAIESAKSQGLLPIIVGGTGMYISALLYGMSEIPNIDPEIRQATLYDFAKLGKEAFYERLTKLDPLIANTIKPGDSQRMIRAYEVFIQTGSSIIDYHANRLPGYCAGYEVVLMNPERSTLYESCNQRFLEFIQKGTLEEVKNILHKITPTTPKILGLYELAAYLKDEISLDEAIALAQRKTRQYAKRQVTWFKNQIGPFLG